MIIGDFERYMRYAIQQPSPFTLEKFISAATTMVNFYESSQLITIPERADTALLLTQAFNAGIANQITAEDLLEISEIIILDTTIDYSILSIIFAEQKGD